MKKIFLFIAAAVMTAGVVSAQDINQATESYNNGAMELQMGNNGAAIEYFQSALTMGEALGDEGAELVANCKKAICSARLSMAKDLYNAKDFEGALTAFQSAKETAEGYGEAEIAAEAADLMNQTNMLKLSTEGKAAMKAKDFATAISCFSKVLEMDPENGATALQLGQAYMNAGQLNEAVAALETAKANGYEVVMIADHGNADNAVNEDGTPNTAHSLNPVPIVVVSDRVKAVKDGILADVAPTVLKMMGLEQPAEMTGEALVEL